MTQVSRYPVSKKIEERMFEVFRSTIASLHNKEDIEDFLQEFFTPTEKIMLAKRLFIAVLLKKGMSYDSIREILHVSPSTLARVSLQVHYAGTGYKKVVDNILQEESIMAFWEKIEDALANIPHSKGASIIEQKKKRAREKFRNKEV